MTCLSKPCVACCVLASAFVFSAPLSAQQGPPQISVEVVNTAANPVPVVVTGARVEELVFFRTGYQVPTGKRLLIDDVSVSCNAVGALPHGNNQGIADFERFGLSTTAYLRVSYANADCPEPLEYGGGGSQICPRQLHVVGTAQTNGTNPQFLADGMPGALIGAGRRLTAFVEERGALGASCSTSSQSVFLIGTGRLIDKP